MTAATEIAQQTALVVGASRGLGRGIAAGLAETGATVIAVARSEAEPHGPTNAARPIASEQADAGAPGVATDLIERHDPDALIVVAGATPPVAALHEQTWESFSTNWQADVQIAFRWLQAALLVPLRPDSRVIVISSGAAVAGSPLSGGYAGAKATQRFMTSYARDEANRSGLEITFTTVLPKITPLTDLGRPAFQAYAARAGISEEQYMERMGPPLTPTIAGAAVAELVAAETSTLASEYLLTGDGLKPLG